MADAAGGGEPGGLGAGPPEGGEAAGGEGGGNSPSDSRKADWSRPQRTQTNVASDPMRKPDVIKLVRAFDRITDPKARKKMLEAVRSAADALAPER